MISGIMLSLGIGIIFILYKYFEKKTGKKGLKNFIDHMIFEEDNKQILSKIEVIESEIKKLNKKLEEINNTPNVNQLRLNYEILDKMRKSGLKLKEISFMLNIPYSQLTSILKKQQKELVN
ncbi:MAG: hypothetical protein N2446_01860 [Elusimicrobiales bacterium]|nr:hypothetical protein [Elusimicrobiales bacterium]